MRINVPFVPPATEEYTSVDPHSIGAAGVDRAYGSAIALPSGRVLYTWVQNPDTVAQASSIRLGWANSIEEFLTVSGSVNSNWSELWTSEMNTIPAGQTASQKCEPCPTLSRIDGENYLMLTAKRPSFNTSAAGTWLFRDSSAGKDGTGPWVLHGTIFEQPSLLSVTSEESDSHRMGGNHSCEILVTNTGRWLAVAPTYWFVNTTETTLTNIGCYYSDDQGANWTLAQEIWDGGTRSSAYGRGASRIINGPYSDGGYRIHLLSFLSATEVYDDQGNRSYVTFNDGLTWNIEAYATNRTFPNEPIQQITRYDSVEFSIIDPTTNWIYWGGAQGSFYDGEYTPRALETGTSSAVTYIGGGDSAFDNGVGSPRDWDLFLHPSTQVGDTVVVVAGGVTESDSTLAARIRLEADLGTVKADTDLIEFPVGLGSTWMRLMILEVRVTQDRIDNGVRVSFGSGYDGIESALVAQPHTYRTADGGPLYWSNTVGTSLIGGTLNFPNPNFGGTGKVITAGAMTHHSAGWPFNEGTFTQRTYLTAGDFSANLLDDDVTDGSAVTMPDYTRAGEALAAVSVAVSGSPSGGEILVQDGFIGTDYPVIPFDLGQSILQTQRRPCVQNLGTADEPIIAVMAEGQVVWWAIISNEWLREFPRDDYLGMRHNGQARWWVRAIRAGQPTSIAASQRQRGQLTQGTYL